MNISPKAVVEIQRLAFEAQSLAQVGKSSESAALLARAANIRTAGLSSEEMRLMYTTELLAETEKHTTNKRDHILYRAFVRGSEYEVRDLIAGQQSVSYSQQANGGTLVSAQFYNELIQGLAQVDPLFDEGIVRLIKTDKAGVLPIPLWDLSGISSQIVSEASSLAAAAAPVAGVKQLNAYSYRTTPIRASFEFEQDSFQPAMDMLMAAFQVGLQRGVGVDLVTGSGVGAPQGILTGASDSGVTTAVAGAVSADDIQNIYFKLNRLYRNQQKTCWLMSDAVYQMVRKAKDANGRPLIDVREDYEQLMGRRIFISPSMPSAPGSAGILFGDLSYFAVRTVGQATFRRRLQTQYIELGEALYTAMLRIDSAVLVPASGTPAIVKATLHA